MSFPGTVFLFIEGPTETGGEIEINYFSVAVGGGDIQFDSSQGPGRGSLYFGLAFTDFDLRVQNAGRNFNNSDLSTEAYLQYGYSHNLNESINIGFTYNYDRDAEDSDIKVEFKGLFIGLNLPF
jgi:hypothetical protein